MVEHAGPGAPHAAGHSMSEPAGTEPDSPQFVPPGVIGFLLILVVVLAIAFYVAAQVVQTP